jgi:MFS family permease
VPAPSPEAPRPAGIFQSLRHRNFRLWFYGQLTSLVGTWMQTIAQNWLVYHQLGGTARDLGLVSFVGAVPLVPLTLYAGAIADRFPKRWIVFCMQAVMMVLAFVLGFLSWTGEVQMWHVLALAFLLGAAQALDTPARQAFVVELAGREDLANAISLNSGIFHGARVIGPAVAGILVASVGIPISFFLNGASFIAVLACLLMMDKGALHPTRAASREEGRDWLAGLRYFRDNRLPLGIALLITVSTLLAMPYHTLIPIYAKEVFKGGAGTYGVLMSAAGIGAVVGALYSASGRAVRRKGRLMFAGSVAFPLLLLLFSYCTNYLLSIALLFGLGFSFVAQSAPANAILQSVVPDQLRGRVLAIYVSLFLGLMRVGSLLIGLLADRTSVQAAVASAGAATLVLTTVVYLRFPEIRNVE